MTSVEMVRNHIFWPADVFRKKKFRVLCLPLNGTHPMTPPELHVAREIPGVPPDKSSLARSESSSVEFMDPSFQRSCTVS